MFKEISADELKLNPFTKIGSDWMLVAAGDEKKFNMLTASWGSVGVMWGYNTATVYIRQSRYTKEFIDKGDLFTISFFKDEYKKALSLCGKVSGRDCDKVKEANLTPLFISGTTAFSEAETVFVCRKIYSDIMPSDNFIEKEADNKWYSDKDYHTMYIGKIEKILVKE